MTREEVIEEMCAIRGLVFHSIGEYSYPSDGFCQRCYPATYCNFQSTSAVIDYIRDAVMKQLKADGVTIYETFDPITGKEIRR